MKARKRICCLLALMLLLGSVLPIRAQAIDLIEKPGRGASLTITSKYGDTLLVGAKFKLYRIAAPDQNCNLTAVAPFDAHLAGIGIDNEKLNHMSNEKGEWEALAKKLGDDIGGISGTAAITADPTDQNGTTVFSGLELGLYLVISEPHKQDKITYQQDAALVMIPNRAQTPEEGDIDKWIYDVTLKPKPVVAKDALKVIKYWDDRNDAAHKRPDSIQVYLLRDGKRVVNDKTIESPVVLSDQNNWEHVWEPLEYGPVWSVEEDTTGLKERRYTAGTPVRDDKGTEYIVYTITNKYSPPPPKLPQTGQLWWPVPVLVSLGLLCMLVGLIRRKGEHNEV